MFNFNIVTDRIVESVMKSTILEIFLIFLMALGIAFLSYSLSLWLLPLAGIKGWIIFVLGFVLGMMPFIKMYFFPSNPHFPFEDEADI